MASRRQRSKDKRQFPRREGVRPTVGLVVEGDAEYYALPRLHKERLIPNCPPLQATNLGGVGSHMSPLGIARMAAGSVHAHKLAGRSKVILCIDLEQRPDCAGAFATSVAQALSEALASRNCPTNDTHVVIANRSFEAWLLADAQGLFSRGVLRKAPKFHRFEGSLGLNGTKGKDDLTQLLERTYSETRDGPRLFASLDFKEARLWTGAGRGSRSLDKFLRFLGI